MGYVFYQYFAFIHPESDLDLSALKDALTSFYKDSAVKPQITLANQSITVSFESYKFEIILVDEPFVAEEAIEIANSATLDWDEKTFDKEALKSCSKRLEIFGQDDFDMNYFNDSLYIIETVEKFKGVSIFSVN